MCAERLAKQARAGGSIVLTGGSTPRRAYELAAELEPDWSRVDVWWGDERCVPPDDEHSNFGMAKAALLDRLAVRAAPFTASASGEPICRPRVRELSGVGAFDLVLLGLGPDGHVASLFPDFPTLGVTDCDVVGTPAGHEPFVDRITLTLPRLRDRASCSSSSPARTKRMQSRALSPASRRATRRAASRRETTRAMLDRAAAAKL